MVGYRQGRWHIVMLFRLAGCVLAALPFGVAQAAFSSFMPLNWGGSVTYAYGYVSASTESERMQLLGSVNASGYVWQPWFARTSATLSLGLTNTESTASSSDSRTATGAFTFSVFPFSRFPFSLTYTRSDTRTAAFSDLTQLSGSLYSQLSRLSLRQTYSSRGGDLSSLWYYRSDFSGELSSSLTENYGFTHQAQSAPNTLTLATSYTKSKNSQSSLRPAVLSLSVNHIYTPGSERGVTNLLTYIEMDSGAAKSKSAVSQGSSIFYWRPEHRALSVTGGVRASKTESSAVSDRKSFDTNLGVNYRLTRRASMRAGLTVGTAESGNSRLLTSGQSLGISYSSHRYPLGAGFDWQWQTSGSAGNSLSRSDTAGVKTSTNVQSYGAGLGHSLAGQWSLGHSSSLSMGFSQGLSANKSSVVEDVSRTLSNSFNLSSNYRARRGQTYGTIQVSDSRSMGVTESVFQRVALNVSQELVINRLSALSGNIALDANRQEYERVTGGTETGYRRFGNVNVTYRHQRPFGIYNLRFNSRFSGSKEIGNDVPSQRLDWDNRFQYSLGLLGMSANFRMTQYGEGVPVKSLYFQATRSF